MTDKIRDLIETKLLELLGPNAKKNTLYPLYFEGLWQGFALAVEMHKGVVEALQLYADSDDFSIGEGGSIFEHLEEITRAHGFKAREALAGLKEQLEEDRT